MRPLLILLTLLTTPALAQSPPDSLVALLRAVAAPLTLTPAGDLTGPAGEVLAARVREARFVLLGEEHGVAEVPRLAEALWRAGRELGSRYLAIEVGEQMAARLEAASRADTTGEEYRRFIADHYPAAPFYFWREDAALLRGVIGSTPGQRGVLWGLDYDILADRHMMTRLRKIAPGPEARRLVDSAAAVMDGAFARALGEQNPGLFYMFGGSPALFGRLREAFRPAAGSEVDRILGLMEETLTINQLFLAGRGYESNLRRSSLLKQQFLRKYDSTRAANGRPPRVLLKFGAAHLIRGLNPSNQFDLGTLLPDLAEADGGVALSLFVMGGAGARQAQFDPRVLRSVEAPAETAQSDWARPFVEAADPARWTVFDLQALRPQVQRLGGMHPSFNQLLYGVDLVIVLSGSGPQHDLFPGPPPRRGGGNAPR
jgi:hypothetical protein